MSKRWKTLLFVVPFSFLLGLSWGLKLIEDEKRETKGVNYSSSLTVLALKGFFSNEVINKFQTKHKIQIELTEVNSPFELIHHTLDQKVEYDLAQVLSYDSEFVKNSSYKKIIDKNQIPNVSKVSADIKGLNKDFYKRSLPIAWDIHLFSKETQIDEDSLKALMEDKKYKEKVSILPSPSEIYFLTHRLGFVVDQWIETGQAEKIQISLKSLFNKIRFIEGAKVENKESVFQGSIGQIHKRIESLKGHQIFFPREKSTLFVYSLSLNENSKKISQAYQFLNFILEPTVSLELAKNNQLPSVNTELEKLSLKEYLKPSYLRQIPLGRIEVPFKHYGYESTWIEALKGMGSEEISFQWQQLSSVPSVISE